MIEKIIHAIYRYSLKSDNKCFLKALDAPIFTQKRILVEIGNMVGKSFSNYQEFCEIVPVSNYSDIEASIVKIMRGESTGLTKQKVEMFEKTSGSEAASKYIPYTQGFLKQIQRGIAPWICDLYHHFGPFKGSFYWAISPKLGRCEVTPSGLPVGFEDDSHYFSWIERQLLKVIFAVSPRVSTLDQDDFWMETAKSLVQNKNLEMISVWNPTFLFTLITYIYQNKQQLSLLVDKKRRSFFDTEESIHQLWPNLKLISCWTDAFAANFIPRLKNLFPNVEIQGKGLLLTEGVITIPLKRFSYPILAINSHFYEFEDPQTGTIFLFDQLLEGGRYIPIISAANGILRYRTNDLVEVKGFYNGIPLLCFKGRAEKVVDLVGEKLHESFVDEQFAKLIQEFSIAPDFMMIAPFVGEKVRYDFFIEAGEIDLPLIATRLDQLLQNGYHYQQARRLGQLEAIEAFKIKEANKLFKIEIYKQADPLLGTIKNPSVDGRTNWREVFNVT